MKRPAFLAATALMVVQGIIVGWVFTQAPHTGGDNAGYVALAHSLTERGTYQELWDPAEPPHTKYPPVFAAMLAVAILLGAKTWVALKMVPVLSTLLAGLFCFLWVRERRGVGLALGVGLVFILSDAVVDYSRWILSDPTFLTLTLGGLWCLEKSRNQEKSTRWLAFGGTFVLLAYFTRSAGLPLVVAMCLWLFLEKRWKPLAGFAAAFLVTALGWWLRGRSAGAGEYLSEFWMVDPYRSELGRAGFTDLVQRLADNFSAYALLIVPEGLVGLEGPLLAPLGVAVMVLGVLGWALTVRRDRSASELFFPLYAGLILLWPQVWSGDRFALPLLPLLLFYAGAAILWALPTSRNRLRGVVLSASGLLVALPALASWVQVGRGAAACNRAAIGGDPFGCYGAPVREYIAVAEWSAENLPEDAVVVTRKPRIFHLLTGVKALSIPLTPSWPAFWESVGPRGAGYLTLDQWGGLTLRYMAPVIQDHPDGFCWITGIGAPGEGAQLLGIQPGGGAAGGEAALGLSSCPPGFVRREPRPGPAISPGTIPLLAREPPHDRPGG